MNPPRRGRGHPLSGTKETCVAPFALGLTPCPCLPCPSAKWFNSIRYGVPGTRHARKCGMRNSEWGMGNGEEKWQMTNG